jgi:phage terminase large subunit-like protein
VVAADTDTVSGKKSGKVLVDEHWLFGKRPNAAAMFMEATGRPGVARGGLGHLPDHAERRAAGGGVQGEAALLPRRARRQDLDPKSLGVLYEFPDDMIESKAYLDPANFYITNPNIGRSVSAEWLEDQLRKNQSKHGRAFQQFLAKHLNVEIGLNLRSDRWAGADFWAAAAERADARRLLERCEVVVSASTAAAWTTCSGSP